MLKSKSEMEKIKILFNKYSKNEKFADKKFVKKMLEYSSKLTNTCEYIDDVMFNSFVIDNNLLSYDKNRQQVIVNMQINEYLHEKIANFPVSYKTKIDINNIMIMKSIFEFTEKLKLVEQRGLLHPLDVDVLQVKNYLFDSAAFTHLYNSDYAIEYIMENSFKIIEEDNDILPINRIAKIKSLKKCLEIISNKEEKNNYLLEYINNELLTKRLGGYSLDEGKVTSPTTAFFNKSGQTKNLDKISWYSKDNDECLKNVSNLYSLNERLDYGLPISVDEYNKVKVKTNK